MFDIYIASFITVACGSVLDFTTKGHIFSKIKNSSHMDSSYICILFCFTFESLI